MTSATRNLGSRVALTALLVIAGFPLFWTLMNSFKVIGDIVTSTPKFVFVPTLDNFLYVFTRPAVKSGIVNSLVVAGSSVTIGALLGIPAAYVIARYPPRNASGIRFFILSLRFLPPVAVAVPLIQIWLSAGMFDTRLALVITYLVISVATITWLAVPAFERVPRDIEEAAKLDGDNPYGIFFRVALPVAMPSLLGAVIFTFVLLWNEFLIALMLTTSDAKTLPIVASEFTLLGRNVPWGILNASTIVLALPPILFIGVLVRFLNTLVRQPSAGHDDA